MERLEKTSEVTMACVSAEVRSECLANKNQKWYRLSYLTRSYFSSKFPINIRMHKGKCIRIVGVQLHIHIHVYIHIHILYIESDNKCRLLDVYTSMSLFSTYFLSANKHRKLPDTNFWFRTSNRLVTLYIKIIFLIQFIITLNCYIYLSSFHCKFQNFS